MAPDTSATACQLCAARTVPKVYIPSLGTDPECHAMSLSDQVAALLEPLRRDACDVPNSAFLTHVICDASVAVSERDRVTQDHGIPCLALPLARRDHTDRYNPDAICELLISLA